MREIKEIEPQREIDGVRAWDVPGWPCYSVGEDGSVWSYKPRGPKKSGKPERMPDPRRLTLVTEENRGASVTLCRYHNCNKKIKVAKLLLAARYGLDPNELVTGGTGYVVTKEGELSTYAEILREAREEFKEKCRWKSEKPYDKAKSLAMIVDCRELLDLQEELLRSGDGARLLDLLLKSLEKSAKTLPLIGTERWKWYCMAYRDCCIETVAEIKSRNAVRPDLRGYIARRALRAASAAWKKTKRTCRVENWNDENKLLSETWREENEQL